MSLVEKKLRYATASHVLNKLRKEVKNKRKTALLDNEDVQFILDAVSLTGIENDSDRILKTISFSFHNTGNIDDSSALQLAEALSKAKVGETYNYLNDISGFVKNKDYKIEDDAKLISFLEKTMLIINTQYNSVSATDFRDLPSKYE
jgi:hypothetical protein